MSTQKVSAAAAASSAARMAPSTPHHGCATHSAASGSLFAHASSECVAPFTRLERTRADSPAPPIHATHSPYMRLSISSKSWRSSEPSRVEYSFVPMAMYMRAGQRASTDESRVLTLSSRRPSSTQKLGDSKIHAATSSGLSMAMCSAATPPKDDPPKARSAGSLAPRPGKASASAGATWSRTKPRCSEMPPPGQSAASGRMSPGPMPGRYGRYSYGRLAPALSIAATANGGAAPAAMSALAASAARQLEPLYDSSS
mmetsp:Transcript_7500/g.30479  ORF Transcript_7500/g.30479 Transcript_7500/m.30479 type:complete len:257 (+) Transcript_7500:599-1369(+)